MHGEGEMMLLRLPKNRDPGAILESGQKRRKNVKRDHKKQKSAPME
jgi:hypothetical protein